MNLRESPSSEDESDDDSDGSAFEEEEADVQVESEESDSAITSQDEEDDSEEDEIPRPSPKKQKKNDGSKKAVESPKASGSTLTSRSGKKQEFDEDGRIVTEIVKAPKEQGEFSSPPPPSRLTRRALPASVSHV